MLFKGHRTINGLYYTVLENDLGGVKDRGIAGSFETPYPVGRVTASLFIYEGNHSNIIQGDYSIWVKEKIQA